MGDARSGTQPDIVDVKTSKATLPEGGPYRRLPRAPWRKRPAEFEEQFEDRILFYDCFAYGSDRVLLIGPPPLNLSDLHACASYVALPSGKRLNKALYPSRSTMITELKGVPDGTTDIEISLGSLALKVPVQPSMTERFAGRRILFTINKDNHLDWIRMWADWHARLHGTDAIILFDNGSQSYGVRDIEAALASVEGLREIAVVSVPEKFGPIDRHVLTHHYWPNFLQISMVSVALRRFGMKAAGLINCDIDELMWANGTSVYDLAKDSPIGVSRVRGEWIEAALVENANRTGMHLDYEHSLKDIRAKLCPPKCVLDPLRDWTASLKVHPYLHRIHRAPFGARKFQRGAMFFHFKGINTNWKEGRATLELPDANHHVLNGNWAQARAAYIQASR